MFNVMLYDIPTVPQVHSLLFADDYVMWKSGRNTKFIFNTIQSHINKMNSWFNSWGFKMSQEKTVGILFSRGKKSNNLQIKLNEKVIDPKK